MTNDQTVTQAAFDQAASETERLQRELDITNADHVALWIAAMRSDFYGLPYAARQAIRKGEQASSRARRSARAPVNLAAYMARCLATG